MGVNLRSVRYDNGDIHKSSTAHCFTPKTSPAEAGLEVAHGRSGVRRCILVEIAARGKHELPSYLQMAQGEPVGATTLGDLTIGALERLFNALPRCSRACVVVTNLKDDVYLDGSGQLRTLIESLTKHYDRNAQSAAAAGVRTGDSERDWERPP